MREQWIFLKKTGIKVITGTPPPLPEEVVERYLTNDLITEKDGNNL